MKRLFLLLAICLTFLVPASFAEDTSETDMYINVLTVNGNYYNISDEESVYSTSGIYFTSVFYKRLFDMEFTLKDQEWTITKSGKVLGKFKDGDIFKLSEEDEVYIANTTGDGDQCFLLEYVAEIVGDDFYYEWQRTLDPNGKLRSFKNLNLVLPESFYNKDLVQAMDPTLNYTGIDKLKSLSSFIKKMSKDKPKLNLTDNSITYADKSCSVIISLTKGDFMTVSVSGTLSKTALTLIELAYNDNLDKSASKAAVAEIKRLNGIMVNPKHAAEFKKLVARDFNDWYYFGEDGFYKWTYEFSTVQDKRFLDFTVSSFYLNTSGY